MGLIKGHVNGRSGYRTDLSSSWYFKSSFEADYCRYLLNQNIKFDYESKTFQVNLNDRVVYYTPDFYLQDENVYVELKGVRIGKSRFSKLVNSNAVARDLVTEVKIKVIYMKDFYVDLRKSGLYDSIPNLENRDYAKTKHLIKKHSEDSKN
jgi:hypothetical protein